MRSLLVVLCGVLSLAVSPALVAQTRIDRPPNLGGTWVPDAGVVRFDFIHRFYVSGPPTRSVVNSPTFTVALGLPNLAVGMRYSTHSESQGEPSPSNDAEFYARWRLQRGAFTVALTPAYNAEAESFDGELGVDWTQRRVTVSGAVRGMSQAFGVDRSRAALAGGAVLRLNDYVALAGDLASMLDTDPGEDPAWSAGLLFVIPGSPHTFSLHVSNVGVNTIQGSSRRGSLSAGVGKPLYGFEFTIPLHLKRFSPWFGGGRAAAPSPAAEAGVAAEVRMAAFKFAADTVVIAAGQTVRWTNTDPVEHTVTFESGVAGSGLLPANGTFAVRFDRPGTYAYSCTPHPFMKGVVVVK